MVDDNYREALRKATDEHTPGDKSTYDLRTKNVNGVSINPLAKYVEAVYTSSDTVVTYNYYESASKATLYNTVTTTYSTAQCTEFTSAAWD